MGQLRQRLGEGRVKEEWLRQKANLSLLGLMTVDSSLEEDGEPPVWTGLIKPDGSKQRVVSLCRPISMATYYLSVFIPCRLMPTRHPE